MTRASKLDLDISNLSYFQCLARQHYDQGEYKESLLYLRYLIRFPELRPFARCALSACFYKLMRPRSAEKWARKSLLLQPKHNSSRFNLANSLVDQGKFSEALTHYHFLSRSNPSNLQYKLYLCHCLIKAGFNEQGSLFFDSIESLVLESDTDTQLNAARLFSGSELCKKIIPILQSLIRVSSCAESYYLFALNLRNLNRPDQALEYAKKAVDIGSRETAHKYLLAQIYAELSMPEQANMLFEELLLMYPGYPVYQLPFYLNTPVIARSNSDLHFYWARTLAGLRKLLKTRINLKISPYLVYPHLFFLAYHRQNMCAPMRAYGDLMASFYGLGREQSDSHTLQSNHNNQLTIDQRDRSSSRIRIGFASEYFSEHSNSRAFEGLIENIDKSKFEVIIVHGPRSLEDETSRRINASASKSLRVNDIRGNYPDCEVIRGLELDILYYTDLGMNTHMNYMAMHRLATIQVTGWGIPHTSGIRTIDYYLSSELAEPSDGDDHYVEKLVRLPGLPCCYLSERLELIEVPREYFFLPPDVPVFGCLQSLYKLHPDFDLALEQLAIANPDAAFVFVESPRANITKLFLERVKRSAPHFHDQLVFLALMHRLEFISLSNVVDVLLDPFYYCSGITFYESTFVGTPTVTMEGKFLRSRFVAAAYRLMGIDNPPVAHSPAEYVALASRLIQNRDELASLRRELRQKAAERLYDDLAYVRGFEAFCQEAVVRHGLRQAAAA